MIQQAPHRVWREMHPVLIVLVAAFMPSGPALSRDEALERYAKVAAASLFAESRCPRFQVRAGQLTTLRMATAITTNEESIIEAKLRKWSGEVHQAYVRNGAADWCSEVYDLLGPSGTIEKGILSKQ
ncbi:hypothetical protein [Methylobacterium sp. WL116]|uniref:hypothetical protein n=1 Tax=Methylobacterium sp. WL116 TaxID=2603889 RepID=UPI0011C9222F|nr:hypothetical protein [Methylobacterium sp. WL116]TXM91872.1 hypothetical protein FV223_13715 [Methylobacterium sp. WL116]